MLLIIVIETVLAKFIQQSSSFKLSIHEIEKFIPQNTLVNQVRDCKYYF